jgi:hypothetical protein
MRRLLVLALLLCCGTISAQPRPPLTRALADSLYCKLGVGCPGFAGSVTSVGAGTVASIFTFSVATPTTTPAISLSFSAQLANCILAGPTSGGNAAPTCRALVSADFPASLALITPSLGVATATSINGITIDATVAHSSNNLSFFSATSSAQLATLLNDETGTGLAVFNNGPTFIAPVLGTPTSGVMTNVTGTAAGLTAGAATILVTPRAINGVNFDGSAPITVTVPISSGVTGIAAGIATFLATPSSANLFTAVTDETGSGLLVGNNTPMLIGPLIQSTAAPATMRFFNTAATLSGYLGASTSLMQVAVNRNFAGTADDATKGSAACNWNAAAADGNIQCFTGTGSGALALALTIDKTQNVQIPGVLTVGSCTGCGGGTSFPLLAPDGTAGAPSYSFTNSATTGMYSSDSNTLALAAGGTTVFTSTSGNANIPLGLFTLGFQATTNGTLRYANSGGPFVLSLTATTPASASRTINQNWSALTATRQLKYANFDMDFSLLGNPFGTNMALTTPTISDPTTAGTTPTISNTTANSCGTTAATITGNDSTGVITVGATAGTSCTITFAVAAPTRRQCTVTNETTANLSRSTFLTTTTSTVEGTFSGGDSISYVCSVF